MVTKRSFIGSAHRQMKAGAFVIGHWTAASHDAVEPHGHHEPHFIWLLSGTFDSMTAADPLSAGSLIFNPSQTFHADHFIGGRGAFLSMTLVDDTGIGLEQFRPPARPSLARSAECDVLLPSLLAACASPDDASLDVEAFGLALFGAVCERPPVERGVPAWLARARDHLRDQDVGSVSDIAKAVGVHPVHLTRVFRSALGCTPAQYQRGWRLRRAAALLNETRLSIAEVALGAGFSDQSHLTRQFRDLFGVGPARYRRLMA